MEEVDEFVGKLQDVGIPPQQGIFVSASRYTQGALKRAHRAGVKPLVFKDLTDEMPEAVRQAFQSIIYVIAEVTRFSIKNNIPRVEAQSDILQFRDDQGNLVGSVADLVWDHWQSGKIPLALGPHTVELTLPSGWRQIVDGQVAEVYSINVTVMALGCVITLAGKVRHVSLVDPTLQETERREISATFERPSGRVPLKMFSSEAELSDFLRSRGNIKLTLGRFRVPRIVWQGLYWPPTKKSYSRIVALLDAFQKGEIPDPRPFKLSEIEGDDLSEAWAPPWDDNPFIRNKTRPEG